MTEVCSAEPVSFLRLERHLLDEVSEQEREQLSAHLHECAACRACFEALRSQSVQLAPLRVPAGRRRVRVLAWPLMAASSWLAVAAAAWLFVRASSPAELLQPNEVGRVKGGALAIELVRERDGDTALEPTTFRDGDRFEVRVTCPPGAAPHWDLVVLQGREAFFPLQPGAPLRCGNRVTLPGAFALTGTQSARVCFVLDEHRPVDRSRLAADLPANGACVVLQRAR